MSKEYSQDELKREASAVGGKIGDFIIAASAPRDVKLALCSLLPSVGVGDLSFADESLTAAIKNALSAAATNSSDGQVDQSTITLLAEELMLRSARQKVATDDNFPTPETARETLLAHTASQNTVADTELVQRVLMGLYRHEQDLFGSDPALQNPPKTAWDGPQPGLSYQVDTQHRYTFSDDTGYLESIVTYDPQGVPLARVHYRLSADTGRPQRIACEMLQKNAVGDTILHENDVYVCINAAGAERIIAPNEKNIFFTPTGLVVTLVEQGTLWRQPRAQYLGRLKGFNPLRPFCMRTAYGIVPLVPESTTILIALDKTVFETATDGLRRVGELTDDSVSVAGSPARSITIDHEYVTIALEPGAGAADDPILSLKIKHPLLSRLVNGPLHRIIGRHPFFHEQIPEMVDIHGSDTAEQQLRELERTAAHVALVMNVFAQDSRPEIRAALLHAQQMLEKKLWDQARVLEELLGSEPQQTLHYPSVRAWISMASTDPERAAADLRRMAQYAA